MVTPMADCATPKERAYSARAGMMPPKPSWLTVMRMHIQSRMRLDRVCGIKRTSGRAGSRLLRRRARFWLQELCAELLHLLRKWRAAARGHGRLLGQPRMQLDEGRPLRLEQLGKPSLEVVDVADGGSMTIARGLGHHDEVHREATRNDLSTGGVIDAVLEEEVDQVPRCRARHGGERSEL